VVKLLPDSQQAVLFDKNRGTHVMVEVGTHVAGYIVDDISEDEVTLSGNGKQIVLAAPADVKPAAKEPSANDEHKPDAKPAVSATAAAPADPYGAEPADPYGDEAAADPASDPAAAAPTTAATTTTAAPTTVTSTVSTPTTTPAPTTAAPRPTVGPTAVPATTVGPTAPATPTVGPAPAPRIVVGPTTGEPTTPATHIGPAMPATPAPATNPDIVLSRVEVDAALGDFGGLLSSVRGELTPAGARIDHLLAGSMLARTTLRVGDVVVSVDGKPLRSLDDAADLYARASSARVVTMQVLRGGKPTTIKLVIR